MLFSRKGFSLVEMLVVMALVGLFLVATNFLTHDVRIAQTNSEKFANTIEHTIKNARNGMIIGKGVYTGGTLFKAEKRIVSITASGI
ncbi:type II secretion system GspH family protein, partial [Candidatus Gracilibacteria bacterium]|nr:type II secretion system GspH family protein [Candidatus Gracilibacteria bacterium]